MPDIAVQVEGPLDLRQVARGHERLLVDEKARQRQPPRSTYIGPSGTTSATAAERQHRAHVHRARDRQRSRDAEPHRDREQPVRTIELQVLARIEHVEAAHPQPDREREQPRLPAAAPAGRQPAADRRHCHGETEKRLRPRRVSLRQRVPEHDGQRQRRQRQAQAVQLAGGGDEDDRPRHDPGDRLRTGDRAARDLAPGGSRVACVPPRVDQTVEPHRRTARARPSRRRSTRPATR